MQHRARKIPKTIDLNYLAQSPLHTHFQYNLHYAFFNVSLHFPESSGGWRSRHPREPTERCLCSRRDAGSLRRTSLVCPTQLQKHPGTAMAHMGSTNMSSAGWGDPHRPVSSPSSATTFGPSTTGINDSLITPTSVLVQSGLVEKSFNLQDKCPVSAAEQEINGVFISFYPFLCHDSFPVQPTEIKLNGNSFFSLIFLCSLKTSQMVTFG